MEGKEETAETLRDRIAMEVLNGLLKQGIFQADAEIEWCSRHAYRYADFMLAARNEKHEVRLS